MNISNIKQHTEVFVYKYRMFLVLLSMKLNEMLNFLNNNLSFE